MTQPAPNLDPATLRVWLVHDWLTGWRGGEKILLELVRMFPRARIATLIHVPGATHPELDARVAQTSFLQKMPGARKNYRNYLPLFPRAARSLKLDADCDLVLSVSHAVAKGVRPPPGIPHICYCNSPMRYIWGLEDQYLSRRSPKRLALKLATPALRRFDLQNDHIALFIGNSINIAQRIQRCYHRDALHVYAGIDHDYFTLPPNPEKPREDFYLCAGALVGYKRIDIAIEAFSPRLAGGTPQNSSRSVSEGHNAAGVAPRKLIIIGTGPDEKKLRRLAAGSPNITFLGRQPDAILRDHYQRCRAFLFPGEEDFGLTPVEAQACGAPVIAYGAGGTLETIIPHTTPNPTGLFFPEQTPTALAAALTQFESLPPNHFSPNALRASAQRFTWNGFRQGIAQAIQGILSGTQIS